MTKPSVLILGARSDIGMAVAHKYASMGHPVQLAARNITSLEADKSDIELRFDVGVTLHEFDALAISAHEEWVSKLPVLPEIAICAVGLMGDQDENERHPEVASLVFRSNFEGPASILAVLANQFEQRGSGTLIGISSVAGERGRATNYIYGSAKAGFTAFLSGLRNRLAKKNVHVLTVLPGFVYTQMTEGMALPAMLTAKPGEIADGIYNAAARRRNVVHLRRIWAIIMTIIKFIPEFVFKKMKI